MTTKARAVIGASFGDEGKGLLTDYFVTKAQEKPIVVRYNGGAQAGHTVVTPNGSRHVFHHYGAGTLAGADTYLSRHFLVNPVAWRMEYEDLSNKFAPKNPLSGTKLYVYPGARVTTPWDMFINQRLEESRTHRHGTCGMGVHETIVRHTAVPLTAVDLACQDLNYLLFRVQNYCLIRLYDLKLNTDENKAFIRSPEVLTRFTDDCKAFCEHTELQGAFILMNREIIFEGAQGLLLDSENKRFFPHVTHSRPGLPNILDMCSAYDEITSLDVTYVMRSYLTRHGAGELPGEDKNLWYADKTNVDGEWQGPLRFAPQNEQLMNTAIWFDIAYNNLSKNPLDLNCNIAITHCDQNDGFSPEIGLKIEYCTYGPTAHDISERLHLPSRTVRYKSP